MTHEVVLQGYNVKPGSLQLGTFDSYGIEKIHVTADDSWDGLAIVVTFNPPEGDAVEVRVPADGTVDVPPEATTYEGKGTIVFCGVDSGVQRITKTMGYVVITHANVGTDTAFTPSEDLAAQVLNAALSAERSSTEANTAAQGAQKAAENAASAAQASAESASKAAAEAAAAKPYAESAKASAEAARDSENQAQQSSTEATAAKNAAQNAQAVAESSAAAAAKSAKEAAVSASNLDNAVNTATQKAAAASTSATAAKASENAAANSEAAAKTYAESARTAKNSAAASAETANAAKDSASASANDAASSKTAAAASEKNAAKSENSAADSAAAAKKSAEDADNTANNIKDSMAQISENKEAVSQLKEDTAALKKRQNVLVGSETGNPVSCNDAYSAPLCGLTVYGKSTQDGTPSPDNPVPIVSAGDDGSIAVKVTGTNMVEGTKLGNRGNVSGVSYTANKDGISFVGKADTALNIYLHNDIKEKLTPGVYYLTIKGLSASVSINFYQVGSFNNDVQNKEVRIVAGKEYSILLAIAKGTAVNGLVVQASLTRNKITSYSPYRKQLLTLPTPNGLPGIPVTSGGNYTDPSGQQWVCDEVDLERGVKVQRVKRVDISSLDKSYWDFRGDTGADTSSTRYKNDAVMIDFKSNAPAMNNILPVGVANIKNTFRLVATPLYLYQFNLDASEFPTVKSWTEYLEANTVLVIYALAIPIETPLTPAEIAAYKALTAYAPDTVVQASDGAGIKLDYQRDVNLVVKNLEDAIASMTTT